jgi:phospholipid/cholesterol/gamma-HCH transport system substrate-binding protein
VVDLGELFNRLGPIVAAINPKEVNTFLDAITQALDGNTQQVSQVIDDLAKLTAALGTRDKAIGHLVEDLDTVSGTLADRDREIRTVLDNLVALATTFSANVDVVDSAITDVGSVSRDAGTLLSNNRGQIDASIAHLVTVLDEVKGRLGTLDTALGDLPKATQAIYRSGRYGEWLNQIILCASNAPPPAGSPCATPISKGDESGGAPDTPKAPPASASASGETTGAAAVRQLLGIGG